MHVVWDLVEGCSGVDCYFFAKFGCGGAILLSAAGNSDVAGLLRLPPGKRVVQATCHGNSTLISKIN